MEKGVKSVRRFLSILVLMGLLACMALPAAAEEAKLYALTEENPDLMEALTFEAGKTLSARFYVEIIEGSEAITATDGFSAQPPLMVGEPDEAGNRELSCESAGVYTIRYTAGEAVYSMTVTVAEAAPPSPKDAVIEIENADDLKTILSGWEELKKRLPEDYRGGDVTLLLPAENLGKIGCQVILPEDAVLVFQGADGTKMTGMTAVGTKFRVSDVTCDPGMTLKVMEGEKIKWNVEVPSGTKDIDGKILETTITPLEKATQVSFDAEIIPLSSDGWSFQYTHIEAADKVYVVNNGKLISSNNTFSVTQYGEYFVVEGAPPTVVTKNAETKTVTISKEQSRYLQSVRLATGFKAAKVTDSKGNTVYSSCDSDGVVSFNVKYNTAETYTIQSVSTSKTVSKTTSRKYSTSQDYFLVTPAGFANAMRGFRDNLVTLNCTEAGKKAISLPVDSMAEAAGKGYQVLVKTKGAELTLDAAALKSLVQQARGTTVLLHYTSLNHKTLSTVGQAAVRSHLTRHPNDNADLAFLVTASSDGETIEDLQLGTITLRIPFIVLPGTEETENMTYALQSERLSEARETTVADGYLTTKLLDLTEHMVFQVGEPMETTGETTVPEETTEETTQPETEPETEPAQPPEPEAPAKNEFPWAAIAAAVLLAVCGAAAGFLFLRKRHSH